MTARDQFLAGERPGDVAIFLSDEHLRNADALADHAERVEGGYVLVVDGERGRRLFPKVAGDAPMEFAQEATKRGGSVDRSLRKGTCPEADGEVDAEAGDGADLGAGVDTVPDADADADGDSDADHAVRFVLAFAQEQTEDAGGLYEEGDVIHAYARCACGTAYSDRWVAGDDAGE